MWRVAGGMAKLLVADDLWAVIVLLLPPARVRPKGGRPPVPDRAALTGILFVLKTGLPWEYLPAEMGCGSGMSCWRRLRGWQQAGVWARLHRVLLERLEGAGQLDPGLAGQRQRGREKAGAATGPNPTDRGKPGTKRHLVVDARGTPLGVVLSGANRHDSRRLAPTLDAVPGVRSGRRGRPRRARPSSMPTRPTTTGAAAPSAARTSTSPLPPSAAPSSASTRSGRSVRRS